MRQTKIQKPAAAAVLKPLTLPPFEQDLQQFALDTLRGSRRLSPAETKQVLDQVDVKLSDPYWRGGLEAEYLWTLIQRCIDNANHAHARCEEYAAVCSNPAYTAKQPANVVAYCTKRAAACLDDWKARTSKLPLYRVKLQELSRQFLQTHPTDAGKRRQLYEQIRSQYTECRKATEQIVNDISTLYAVPSLY